MSDVASIGSAPIIAPTGSAPIVAPTGSASTVRAPSITAAYIRPPTGSGMRSRVGRAPGRAA